MCDLKRFAFECRIQRELLNKIFLPLFSGHLPVALWVIVNSIYTPNNRFKMLILKLFNINVKRNLNKKD